MEPRLDHIVLSSNDNPLYREFWPIVSQAWARFFPEARVHLAFVTNRPVSDPLLKRMRQYGHIQVVRPLKGYPTGNLAKISRHMLSAHLHTVDPDAVCMVNDVDILPLQRAYFLKQLAQRNTGELLAIGTDQYKNTPHAGKWPMVYTTAEADVWWKILNPGNVAYPDIVHTWRGLRDIDRKEDPSCVPACFSDESWLRALVKRWGGPVCRIGPYGRRVAAVDRSRWSIDREALAKGLYVDSHMLRPFSTHVKQLLPLLEYLCIEPVVLQEGA